MMPWKSAKINGQSVKKLTLNGGVLWEESSVSIAPTYTGVADIVIKSRDSGYATLLTSGTFSFGETVPATVDLYLVSSGGLHLVYVDKDTAYTFGGYVNKGLAIPISSGEFECMIGSATREEWDEIISSPPSDENVKDSTISIDSVTYSSMTDEGWGVIPERTSAKGSYNTVTDFWGRSWAQCGYGRTTHIGTNSSGEEVDVNQGGMGGSSPIGGGGSGGGMLYNGMYIAPAEPMSPYGAKGGTPVATTDPSPLAGQDSYETGGAGGGAGYNYSYTVDGANYSDSARGLGGTAHGTGGAGGKANNSVTDWNSGGGGGAQGGCSGGESQSNFAPTFGHPGDGVIIIRWGDAEL